MQVSSWRWDDVLASLLQMRLRIGLWQQRASAACAQPRWDAIVASPYACASEDWPAAVALSGSVPMGVCSWVCVPGKRTFT